MMENVPVKIAERYKPPPPIRQHSVPLSLNKYKSNYYSDSPEFQYDFQLERKVLATVPEWRRMRRLNVEARRERQEKRKEQRIRVIEENQKQLLGAVSYPSAEDLSSSSLDSGDEENIKAKEQPTNQQELSNNGELVETTAKHSENSFYNILQPTILTENNYNPLTNTGSTNITESKLIHKNIVVGPINNSSSFNYKDFEEDTSSPFDNIELKTINDLDILAQVLHNTQLQKNSDSVNNVLQATGVVDSAIADKEIKNEQNSNEILRSSPIDTAKESTASKQTRSIPNVENTTESDQFNFKFQHNYYTQQNDFQKPIALPPYAGKKAYSNQHQTITNMNYVISTNCNGYDVDQTKNQNYNILLSSPPQQMSHNSNNKANFNICTLQRFENENGTKSKSVPDIIRELSQEVCNSEKRRNRNYSQNLDNDLNTTTLVQNAVISTNQSSPLVLSPELQQVVENISSMGFPVERVANLIKKIGADDKKIIEHLIPLTELLDLGFEESKISEALFKYENNKEKALEYLIS